MDADVERFRTAFQRSEELLVHRKKLMESNQSEVASIIQNLQSRLSHVESLRQSEVSSLQLLLDATVEKLRIAERRLHASESAQAEQTQETEYRISILQQDLDSSKREFALLQDSMKALVRAHRKAAGVNEATVSEKKQHQQRERDLELREVHLVDQLSDAKGSLCALQEQLTNANDKCADLERSWLQAQRDLSAAHARIHQLEGTKSSDKEVARLRESVRLLEDTTSRLLTVISTFCTDGCGVPLERAREVFRHVAAMGSHRFVFLGDAALREGLKSNRGSDELVALQDLKTCVADFSSHMQQSSTARGNAQQAPRIDPFLRLQTEKEYWLPKQVVQVAADFHSRYFRDAVPVDVVYSLVVSVATALRDYASNLLSPGECALLDLERRERAVQRAKESDAAVRREVANMRSSAGPVRSLSSSAKPSCTDVLRSISGVRCLISQIDKLCTSSAVFKSLPASHVRDILTVTLRCLEARGGAREERADADASNSGGRQSVGLCAKHRSQQLDGVIRFLLDLCSTIPEVLERAMRNLKNALKAPNDPSDPEFHVRDCCASRQHTTLTRFHRGFLLASFEKERKELIDISVELRDCLLGARVDKS